MAKTSKYRHAQMPMPKKDNCFIDAKPSQSVCDLSNLIDANSKVFALPWHGVGGGRVAIFRHDAFGKVPSKVPLLLGHTGPVIDVAFNPFVENLLATASEDATIRLWSVPPTGISNDVTESTATFSGHGKKINILTFHPSASNVLVSASNESIKSWDLEKGEKGLCNLHTDQILSLNFNLDGSLINTTSKDKKLRIVDLRNNRAAAEVVSHEGIKSQRSVWAKRTNLIVTVGFNKDQYRQLAVWDPRRLTTALVVKDIDRLSSVIMPLLDEDTGLLYLAGKGDSTIKTYELCPGDTDPILPSADYAGNDTQKGLCFLPKSTINPRKGEIAKLLRVTGSLVQPLSITVPRKLAETQFQEDLYPPTFSSVPAMSADAYFSGANAEPTLMTLRPLFDGTALSTGTITAFTPAAPKKPVEEAVKNVQVVTPNSAPPSVAPSAKNPQLEETVKTAQARVDRLRDELAVANAELAKLTTSKATEVATPPSQPVVAKAPPPPGGPKMAGGKAPPPPPPPPPPLVIAEPPPSAAGESGNSANALFAEINAKGGNITSGLKKVTNDQKNYKQVREVQAVSFEALDAKKKALESKEVSERSVSAAEPKFELQGNRFIVKDQAGTSDEMVRLSITDSKLNHAVQISKCINTVLEITGKCNCVTITDCKKVFVVINQVVSTVQITASGSVSLYVNGFVPCITVDQSCDIDLFLKDKDKCRDVEVVTATSTAVNVCFPNEKDPEETLERPVPEQFATKVVKGPKGYKLVTTPSALC